MNSPRPIDTAPKDGTVILTDLGVMCYLVQSQWASPVPKGWALCTPDGMVLSDSDEGISIENPKLWTPLPDWMDT